MRIFAIFLIIFFVFLQNCNGQNLTASVNKVVAYVGNNYTFNVFMSNIPSGTSINLSCSIILWSPGYSLGTIVTGSPVNNAFTVFLSNFTVGRISNIQCAIGSNSTIANVTVGLSVRPKINALVCSPPSAIIVLGRFITAIALVKFTDPLLVADLLTCSSNNMISGRVAVTVGLMQTTLNLSFNNSVQVSEFVSCNFTGNSLPTFTFTVTFQNARIYFSPNVIVTDSPSSEMNLFINFQPYQDLTLNCYAISNNTSPVCANISQNNSIPNWRITSNIIFVANSTVTSKTVSLVKVTSMPGIQDLFSVVCCNTDFIATASVTLNYPANDNSLQASTGETTYSYLQFYQMSLCPCDITVGQCDLNCCCDTLCDCSSSNVIPISGPYGGYFNDTPRYSCQSTYEVTTEPYHSLLCVQFNTTNYLGYYYNTSALIQNNDAFQNSLNSATRNSFQFSVLSQDLSTNKISAYSANGAMLSFLYLPKRIDNSISCNVYNPVVLMEPYDSFCPYIVTSDNCETITDPRLSFANYLISTTVIETNCINNISLMNINQNTPIYTFYQNSTQGWDNGYTLPSAPYLTGKCNSVVTSVNYTIGYNTTSIVYIRADIVLSNVEIGSLLYQRFVVSFVKINATSTILANQSFSFVQNDANLLTVTQISSSGLYGYEYGLPIILNNSLIMKTFLPNPSGICQPASSGSNVLFYKDSYIQCQYVFSNSTCNGRRQEVQAYLDSFLSNSAIAIYGSPQNNNDYVNVVSNFVASVNNSIPSGNTNSSHILPVDLLRDYCVNITTGVAITIYYSRQGKVRSQYIYNIRGVLKSYQLGTFYSLLPNGGNTKSAGQITLTSTVEYVMISASIQGDLNTDDKTQVVCLFDVCIEEILYPWLQQYEGKQGFYELAFGVMLLGLAVFLLVTTHPWW